MADWLKVRHALVRSAKVRMLMRELHCNKMTALGLALAWLCWVDEQTEDGQTHLSPDELADELGFRGCAEALCSIGWAALGEDGCVVALEFGKHCGASAKARAENARYQAGHRLRCGKEESKNKSKGLCKEKILREALPEENRREIRKEVVGSSTVDVGAAAKLPPPPEGFCEWVCALCRAHPSASRNRVLDGEPLLAQDVRAAALEAFARCPQAVEAAPLLAAYFADRLQQDRFKRAFYRPPGQAHFFRDLEDVLAHAERWACESGWGKAKLRVQKVPSGGRCTQDATPEEVQAEFARMRAAGRKGDGA